MSPNGINKSNRPSSSDQTAALYRESQIRAYFRGRPLETAGTDNAKLDQQSAAQNLLAQSQALDLFQGTRSRARPRSIQIRGNRLLVFGTTASDQISAGRDPESKRLYIEVNGQRRYFSPQEEGRIEEFIILGGNGNDAIDVSTLKTSGQISIFAGAGDDTVTGSSAADRISGGEGNDTIHAGAGHDVVLGGAGDDLIHGGRGWDLLDGGTGNDTIHGGAGQDRIYGGDGNDQLNGNRGNDRIEGGKGDDRITGGKDADVLMGNQGDDQLMGERPDAVFQDDSSVSLIPLRQRV